MPPSCGCVIVAAPLPCHCPCPSLPFLQAQGIITYHQHGALGGSLAWWLLVPPPGHLFTSPHFLQLLCSSPGFLPWTSSCPQGIWDFVPWFVPLTLKGMLSSFCPCNFYYFHYFIHSCVCLLIPGTFPALTPDLAEAVSCYVRHLSDAIADFLSLRLRVGFAYSLQGGVLICA